LLLLVVKLVHKSEVLQAAVPVSEVANSTSIDTSKKDVMLASSAPVAASNVTKHHATPSHDAKANPHAKADASSHAKTDSKADKDKKKDKDKKAAKQDGKSNREPAVISLTVKPWGEVYLDGKMIDVSPPLTKLDVPAGPHVIELKNANFPVYKQVVNAKAGDKIKINYKFAN
jgi:serine/threonine-protein kinase